MSLMASSNCNCCSPDGIGFDRGAFAVMAGCFPDKTAIINLAADISRINTCRLVFAGHHNTCGAAINFDAGDYLRVKEYIRGGGRFWLSLEFRNFGGGPGLSCLTDPANVAAFLTALGSSIVYNDDTDPANDGGGCAQANSFCTAGTANIAQGGVTFQTFTTATLSGGTSVWKTKTHGLTTVAVEKIGAGFLFVSGDGNHLEGCPNSNCQFLKRLLSYEDGAII